MANLDGANFGFVAFEVNINGVGRNLKPAKATIVVDYNFGGVSGGNCPKIAFGLIFFGVSGDLF